MAFFAVSQHTGLREDVLDHRLNTRTIYMNPVLRFLYSNMNYHTEHHMFPTVPYYSLPALHREVKGYLAPASPNTWSAYRQILSTLRRQWRDPAYDEPRTALPAVTNADRGSGDTGHTVWAGDRRDGWFDLGPASALAPGLALRVDVGDETYALFRLDDGTLACTEGLCTHGQAHLAEGVVLDCLVECPKHNGRFDLRTGAAVRRPATNPITLYPVEICNGRVISNLQPEADG